jgi:hypothetical protein
VSVGDGERRVGTDDDAERREMAESTNGVGVSNMGWNE